MRSEPITIDGSHGEGGGQILRTALALSAHTGRPVTFDHIRAGRTKPGLRPQHLAAVRMAAQLCGAEVTGAEIGSSLLHFTPTHRVRPGAYRLDIGTAGATTLVAQTALLPLILAAGHSTLVIEGGTHVPFSPPAEHLAEVWGAALVKAGAALHVSTPRVGFYPKGGGELAITIGPTLELLGTSYVERGPLTSLSAYLVTAGLPDHVTRRGSTAIEAGLRDFPVEIVPRDRPSNSPGAAVVIVARCTNGLGGFTALGEPGKPIERVAEEACLAFRKWWASNAATDPYLADQLVLPAVLARGCGRWTTPVVTEHLRTVAWVVQHFLPVSLAFDQRADGLWRVEARCG